MSVFSCFVFVKMDLNRKSRRITQPLGFHTTGSCGQTSRSDIRRRNSQKWRHEKLIWKDSVLIVFDVFCFLNVLLFSLFGEKYRQIHIIEVF